MPSRRWFWAAVALQLLVLVGMVGRHSFTLATGHSILLTTAPVDPWDLFRGQYVRLSYEISRLDQATLPMAGAPYRDGQEVWVVLQRGEPYWTAVAVSDRRPQVEVGFGQVAIQGRVDWSWADGSVTVHYGIEQFYVPEGEGPKLEEGQRNRQVAVEAKVDAFGRTALNRVLVDGEELRWR